MFATLDCLVVRPFGRAERSAVPRPAVQSVVDPLRHRKERRVALDDEPARVDPAAPRVGEQRLEHLGNAAAGGGRVHAYDSAPGEPLPRLLGHRLEAGHPLPPDQRLKARSVERLHLHLLEPTDAGGGHPTKPLGRADETTVTPRQTLAEELEDGLGRNP